MAIVINRQREERYADKLDREFNAALTVKAAAKARKIERRTLRKIKADMSLGTIGECAVVRVGD